VCEVADGPEGGADQLHACTAVAAAPTGIRRPYTLMMQEGLTAAARKDSKALSEVQRLAAAAGAEIKTLSKHDLNMLSDNRWALRSMHWHNSTQHICALTDICIA